MEKYVNQLIEDIENMLDDNSNKPWDSFEPESESEKRIEDANEEFLNGEQHQIQHIIGLSVDLLPSHERLTDNQITQLVNVIELLFEKYNFELAYPDEDLTDRAIYILIRKELTTYASHLNYGRVGIEFCDYDIEHCPIPGLCKGCEKMLNEINPDNINNDTQNIALDAYNNKQDKTRITDTDQIIDKVRNFTPRTDNIHGIYNYCDRWCERCEFTDRCSNYEFFKEININDDDDDDDNYFENMEAIFQSTLDMLKSKSVSFDIDLEILKNNTDDIFDDLNIIDDDIFDRAVDYSVIISKWLDDNYDFFSDVGSNLWNNSPINYRMFSDLLDIIGYYFMLIPTKVRRALTVSIADNNAFTEDNLGSAKVALVSIDITIEAFSILHSKLKTKEDEILTFLSILSKLRTDLEKAIPGSREFIRPGLDEDI